MRVLRRLLAVLAAGVCVVPGSSLSPLAAAQAPAAQAPAARTLRIIAFGAHPDDAELKFAGTATLFAAQGHKVKEDAEPERIGRVDVDE